ncbi:MAG: hypothetical protein RIC19_09655 [Phaeodactylibacter sp.]|uniref:hypothetical protein n=1 Tax=Phaeodactylibacter sp. TaxID=1940289 RepID=UPI0032EDF6B2
MRRARLPHRPALLETQDPPNKHARRKECAGRDYPTKKPKYPPPSNARPKPPPRQTHHSQCPIGAKYR